jgi:hypothetical protein
MTMPNFFIIGAQKAGTTLLYRYLDQHPRFTAVGVARRTFLPPTSKVVLFVNRVRQVLQSRLLVKPPIDPTIRRELLEGYKEDILKPQELLGRDLSLWLKDDDRKNVSAGG